MKRIEFGKTTRLSRRTALCLAAVLAVSACASEGGEKGVEEPFPELAEVPPRQQVSSTVQEREALRKRLERRREEIQSAAAALLRGGTEPVPLALDSQVPAPPDAARSPVAPPPLPAGLPQPPQRPENLSDSDAPVQPEASGRKDRSGQKADDVIAAPEKAQMPPARAAGEDEDSGDEAQETASEEADDG